MDITLTIADSPRPETAEHPNSYKWPKRGDIVFVEPMTGLDCHNPAFVLIHVTAVPDRPIEQIKRRLLQSVKASVDGDLKKVRYRKWRIMWGLLPQGARQKLLADRIATVSWNKLKKYVRSRMVLVITDGSQDGDGPLTDQDV